MMIEFDGDLQNCGFQPHLRAQSLALSTIGLAPERSPSMPRKLYVCFSCESADLYG